jgi:hypothetical protein
VSTQLELIREIASELGYAVVVPTILGTTTTLTDTSGDSPLLEDDDEKLYQNAWVMCESDSAETPLNVGEIRRVTGYTPSQGKLTLARALPNAPTTTQRWGVYFGAPPLRSGVIKGMDEYINEVLRTSYYRRSTLITDCPDGDMEDTHTIWTATDATAAKADGLLGSRCLRVTNSAADGHASTPPFYVQSGGTIAVIADVSSQSGTAQLNVRDADTDEVLLFLSSTYSTYRRLSGTAQIPEETRQVVVEIGGHESNAITDWCNVTVRPARKSIITLPTWLTNPNQLEGVYGWHTTCLSPESGIFEDFPIKHLYPEMDGQGVRAELGRFALPSEQLFACGLSAYDTLAELTDTTDAPAAFVKAVVLARLFRDREDKSRAEAWSRRARAVTITNTPHIRRIAGGFGTVV